MVRIVARSALHAILIGWLYFVIGLTLAVTLIYWRETGNRVWLARWADAFVWVLISMGALMLLLLIVSIIQRYKLTR